MPYNINMLRGVFFPFRKSGYITIDTAHHILWKNSLNPIFPLHLETLIAIIRCNQFFKNLII